MRSLIVIIAFTLAGISWSQSKYENGMTKAMQLWQSGSNHESALLFQRIAQAEPDNWIPPYYASYVLISDAFAEKNKDKLSVKLEKAQQLIDSARLISPDNPEILVMQAMLYTAWIAFDGASYGMMLSPKVSALYSEALNIAPENPRVVLSKAQWDMGSARYFGKDIAPFCKDVERALELFANFKKQGEFYPDWGEDRAKQILESCEK